MGCQGGGFFALFSGQSAQCGPVNNQIQQTRGNLDRIMGEIQRLQGNSADREGQRRAILTALGQNDCGPQYRRYANQGPGNFFENLFGVQTTPSGADVPLSGTYRTLCVRTCDGYYFPVSYSTVPSKFADDERLCQRMCPATEAVLYTHRNPGEDVTRAVSATGGLYTQLPNAFSLSQGVQQCLQLPDARTELGGRAAAARRPDDRARRYRRPNRRAGQGAVAATAGCAGQTDTGQPLTHRFGAAAQCKCRTRNAGSRPRRPRPNPASARCGLSARLSYRAADDLTPGRPAAHVDIADGDKALPGR